MVVGTVFLAALALVAGEQVTVPRLLETWLAFWYLVLIGTVAVFLLFLFVLPALDRLRDVLCVRSHAVRHSCDRSVAGSRTFVVGGAVVLLGVYLGALASTRRVALR
jgi:hypothetical protein